ncbi:MAG: DUF4124 domain-containing protein [Salinisphaera sp.]|nr:DUF4124 domain-containing protein [Salinisphaera sp.]
MTIFALALLLPASDAAAQTTVYKCETAQGTVYSGQPCAAPTSGNMQELHLQPPPPTDPAEVQRRAAAWLGRMAEHGNGVALVPARTETTMFYTCVWGMADGVLFLQGRPHFHHVDGTRARFNSGAPIALVAYGRENLTAICNSGLGFVVIGHG